MLARLEYHLQMHTNMSDIGVVTGAGVKMEHFQAALDPRKQELLEARFMGVRVSVVVT